MHLTKMIQLITEVPHCCYCIIEAEFEEGGRTAHLGTVFLHGNANLDEVHLCQVGLQQQVFSLQELIVLDLHTHAGEVSVAKVRH